MNEIYETGTFTKLYYATEKAEQDWIEKIKDQLQQNKLFEYNSVTLMDSSYFSCF